MDGALAASDVTATIGFCLEKGCGGPRRPAFLQCVAGWPGTILIRLRN
jgi:hypothetical protein